MDDFQQQLQLWNNFFEATAQVGGALVGLVFVALTFNKALGSRGDPMMRLLARQTFGDFVKALAISLSLLVPINTPGGVGLSLILVAGVDTAQLLRGLLPAWKAVERVRGEIKRRLALTFLANGLLIVGGVVFLRAPVNLTAAFWLLFAGMILLLIAGCRSAWFLLVHEQDLGE